MLLHPVERRGNGHQIFVDCLGSERLLGTPRQKRVGRNILDLYPQAFMHEAANAIFEFADILAVAAHGLGSAK
jgi:hypothetical protein